MQEEAAAAAAPVEPEEEEEGGGGRIIRSEVHAATVESVRVLERKLFVCIV